jgi:hypothetical protein
MSTRGIFLADTDFLCDQKSLVRAAVSTTNADKGLFQQMVVGASIQLCGRIWIGCTWSSRQLLNAAYYQS